MIYKDYDKVEFKNGGIFYNDKQVNTDDIKYAYISGQYSNFEFDSNDYNYITKLVLNNGDEYWLTKSFNLKHPKSVMNHLKFVVRSSKKNPNVKELGSTIINIDHLDATRMTKDEHYRVRAMMDDGKRIRVIKTTSGIIANHYFNKLSKYIKHLDNQEEQDLNMER